MWRLLAASSESNTASPSSFHPRYWGPLNPSAAASYSQLSCFPKWGMRRCPRPAYLSSAAMWRWWKSLLFCDLFSPPALSPDSRVSVLVELRCFLCGSCPRDVPRVSPGHTMAWVRGVRALCWGSGKMTQFGLPLGLVIGSKLPSWSNSQRHAGRWWLSPLCTPGGRPGSVPVMKMSHNSVSCWKERWQSHWQHRSWMLWPRWATLGF